MEEQQNSDQLNISNLPEDCISHILSLTSPRDACRCAVVSSKFCSASQSDAVWDRFLPPFWEYIVSRSASPLEFSSKKELYFHLCHSPVLVDGTKNKSFGLDKSSGKIYCMLGPGELSMSWDKNSFRATREEFGLMYFRLPEYQPAFLRRDYKPAISRFSEITHINDTGQLLIQATIKRQFLSPSTHYVAYFVYESRFNGLEFPPLLRVSVRFIEDGIEKNVTNDAYFEDDYSLLCENEGFHPRDREDGWTEIEIGEFFNGENHDDDGVVEMFLWEVRGAYIRMIRNGLIVQGIELRPKVIT